LSSSSISNTTGFWLQDEPGTADPGEEVQRVKLKAKLLPMAVDRLGCVSRNRRWRACRKSRSPVLGDAFEALETDEVAAAAAALRQIVLPFRRPFDQNRFCILIASQMICTSTGSVA
jgi:hypothetical protein